MKLKRLVLSCLALIVLSASAKADCGGLGLGYLFGYGGFGNVGLGTTAFGPPPPYFALHPPVYYGKRYARPYGVSPYAAWPQLQPAAGYAPQQHVNRAPHMITNQYFPPAAPIAPVGGVVSNKAAAPLEIENPYFDEASSNVRYTAKSN